MSQITELNSEILFLQAELEQARCDVKTLEIDNIQWHDEAVVKAKQIEKLKAENEKLREALIDIANPHLASRRTPIEIELRRIANAALDEVSK